LSSYGVGAGTDTTAPAVVALYGLTGLITYFLAVYRIVLRRAFIAE